MPPSPPSDPVFRPLTPWDAGWFSGFTFPRFAPLLGRVGRGEGILAMGLEIDRRPVGLALSKAPGPGAAELLSLWVEPDLRGMGHGTRLLKAWEDCAASKNFCDLKTIYRTTLPMHQAFERVLEKCDWSPPVLRMLVMEAEFDEIVQSPFMQSPPPLDPDFEILPWHEVGADEIERLGAPGQFSVEVWPLNFGPDYHRETSLGVRWRGELVGWVVNHPISPEKLRFTTSFLRQDLQRRGRFAAVQAESVWRMKDTPMHQGIWTVPVEFPRMLAFAKKRLAPFCFAVSETRGATKRILPQ